MISYVKKIIPVLGICRNNWVPRPPYNPLAPSSAPTLNKVCKNEWYLRWPSSSYCLNRVRTTSCGYVRVHAILLDIPAASMYSIKFSTRGFLPQSLLIPRMPLIFALMCSYITRWMTVSVTPKYEADRPR